MDKSLTAEEKLLKVIRRKSLSSAKRQESGVQGQSNRRSSGGNESDALSLVNNILMIVCLVAGTYLVYQYIHKQEKEAVALQPGGQTNDKRNKFSLMNDVDRPFDEYLAMLEQRNIFEMPWEKSKPQETPVAAAPAPQLSESIRVLGIVLDNQPQAILEDVKTSQTVFVSVGQTISDAVVEEIREGKVIFNYHGQKVELTQ